ncbi:hypothetical protein K469DRAFT_750806 [Zopfia rhizophila CBS 207.26]|uniref:Uncharacterized protein n=1 Tax=Zopfia rhizophila CBS 207.26 TaxID=1314779 RepID=A0A6A6DYI8_9PEZI|nr:hypothetical protein K469DRAFT_750806 [Zopfia rhizophila CBS 207.26]
MASGNVDIYARFVNALRRQAKAAPPLDALPCPYCRTFVNSASYDPSRAQALVRDSALELKAMADRTEGATAGGRSTPDLTTLSLLETGKGRQPPYGKKRHAEFHTRRGKVPGSTEVYDPDYSRDIPHTIVPERPRPKAADSRLFDPKQSSRGTASPYRPIQEPGILYNTR